MSQSIDDATIKSPQGTRELANPSLESAITIVNKDNVITFGIN